MTNAKICFLKLDKNDFSPGTYKSLIRKLPTLCVSKMDSYGSKQVMLNNKTPVIFGRKFQNSSVYLKNKFHAYFLTDKIFLLSLYVLSHILEKISKAKFNGLANIYLI